MICVSWSTDNQNDDPSLFRDLQLMLWEVFSPTWLPTPPKSLILTVSFGDRIISNCTVRFKLKRNPLGIALENGSDRVGESQTQSMSGAALSYPFPPQSEPAHHVQMERFENPNHHGNHNNKKKETLARKAVQQDASRRNTPVNPAPSLPSHRHDSHRLTSAQRPGITTANPERKPPTNTRNTPGDISDLSPSHWRETITIII